MRVGTVAPMSGGESARRPRAAATASAAILGAIATGSVFAVTGSAWRALAVGIVSAIVVAIVVTRTAARA